MSLESGFINTVDVWRATVTRSSIGAAQASFNKIKTAMCCRIMTQSQAERVVQGRQGEVSSHKMLCRASENVGEGDEVREGSKVYRIIMVDPVKKSQGAARFQTCVLSYQPV
jgi:hypothetical protein